jgi:hypothetical protein
MSRESESLSSIKAVKEWNSYKPLSEPVIVSVDSRSIVGCHYDIPCRVDFDGCICKEISERPLIPACDFL